MILLEFNNRMIEELLNQRVNSDRQDSLDVTLADFDGVLYHLSTPDQSRRTFVQLSMQWRCMSTILEQGGNDVLAKEYGQYKQNPENGFDVTIAADLSSLSSQDKKSLPNKFSFLKRNLMSAPFVTVFNAITAGSAKNKSVLPVCYREDEAFYIIPEGDRCIVIFATRFKDAGDQILSTVFLKEFGQVRKSVNNAPAVTYSQREPPLEIQNEPNIIRGDNIGYVSFVLFNNHIHASNQQKTIDNIQTFRNYLHYHLKCSKAYMHERMRTRVDTLLQVLNRAKPPPFQEKEKKKMSGRTFVRK